MRLLVVLIVVARSMNNAYGFDYCPAFPSRWHIERGAEDLSHVEVKDSSSHNIMWKWNGNGGSWNVTYTYKYPSEWYAGTATFINYHTGNNACVTWGSSNPWRSNAVRIHGSAWNITYNGDVFGFVPTGNGKYIFKIFSKNKMHNPFGEPVTGLPALCQFTCYDYSEATRWWLQQKLISLCEEPTLNWSWQGSNGRWTVVYVYFKKIKKTICTIFYQNGLSQKIKVVTWELDETRLLISYVTNPIRIREKDWQFRPSAVENWGFTSSSEGFWSIRFYSRNMALQPFQTRRGTFSIKRA